MKLGILTGVLGAFERKAAFARAKELGFDAVELGTGEFTTDVHAGLERLGQDSAAVAELQTDLADAGLELSALSCHGNPLHPQEPYATRADDILRRTIAAASALGVENVVCFSGCPGEPGGQYPNWITTPWPGYFDDLLEWQWAEQLIPYWTDVAAYAAEKGVRIAIEMHPGMSVYNLPTLLRLRDACGPAIGANYDPSHLWWQGMDPILVLRETARAGALFHVHAKDTFIDPLGRRALRSARERIPHGRRAGVAIHHPRLRSRPRLLARVRRRAPVGGLRRRPQRRARGPARADRRGAGAVGRDPPKLHLARAERRDGLARGRRPAVHRNDVRFDPGELRRCQAASSRWGASK